MRNLAILGSTGSIGCSTLDVVKSNPGMFDIQLLAAKKNHSLLLEQIKFFKPNFIYLEDEGSLMRLKKEIKNIDNSLEVINKEKDLLSLISSSVIDTVVAAVVGIAGLNGVEAALSSGKRVLLANKESYVVAGEYLNEICKESGGLIIPLDSEHSAIHQCLSRGNQKEKASKVILTGSGGPFLNKEKSDLMNVTVQEAINHPIWSMGKKISVDSSTLMNKGLELIEAKWLFESETKEIEIIIHPEGIVHSLVEFGDRSIIAQMGKPDMKIPIAYALGFPNRINSNVEPLNLSELGSLTFLDPDYDKFPCLGLAQEALVAGGTAPALLNAANEVAVEAFLSEGIKYFDIPKVISEVLEKNEIKKVDNINSVKEVDLIARRSADLIIKGLAA
ncbi:MAG: 1-deoxy-D-xylulose-5-phosphate reductoisomerase [Gammaproteobacteria bacterium]